MLAVGPAAASYSERIRSLLGYSIHPPFMGHIDGLHPLRRLDQSYDPRPPEPAPRPPSPSAPAHDDRPATPRVTLP